MTAGPAVVAVRADLRLVPPAAAAWCAALLVVHAPERVAQAVVVPGLVLAVAAVAVLVAASRDVAGAGPCGPRTTVVAPGGAAVRGRARRAWPAVVLSGVTAATVLVAGAAAQQARAPAVLLAAAEAGEVVEVVGRVSSAPVRLGDRVRLTVVTSAVRVDGTWRRARAPVDVVGPSGAVLDAVVHVRGTPAVARRGDAAAVRVQVRQPFEVTAPPRDVHAWAGRVRDAARAVAAPLPPDVRGLLPAVTVGDTGHVPEDLVAAMRTAGLAHVMAVSGAHFAILGTLVLTATAALGAPRPVRVLAATAAGAALLLVVGPAPSVVRAAVMGGVGLVGLLAGRRAAGPAALATAVVALLVADPWLSVDVGFALSVAATAGLVVLGAPMVERWSPRCGREGAALLAAPVAAQLGCLPVMLGLWPSVGAWTVVANVVVAPAVAPATVLGLAAALLADVWPAGADLLASTAGAAAWWIAQVARWCAALPGAAVPWWPGVGGAVSAALVLVGASALVLRPPR